MSQLDYTPKSKKGQHLSYEEWRKIEILPKAGHEPEEIGKLLGNRSKRTIQREIAPGKVELLNSDYTTRIEYSADVAQKKHDYEGTAKGPALKIGLNHKLIKFIEDKIINEKYSPSAALADARAAEGVEVNFCEKTLYKYIELIAEKNIIFYLTNQTKCSKINMLFLGAVSINTFCQYHSALA